MHFKARTPPWRNPENVRAADTNPCGAKAAQHGAAESCGPVPTDCSGNGTITRGRLGTGGTISM